MKYLLDSDVLIDNLRRRSKLSEKVVNSGATSIINLGELVYGAFKSIDPSKSLDVLENFLEDLELDVVNLEKETIYIFGKLKADLEKKGIRLDDFDLLIAAVAIFNNLTLVTRNIRHFKRIKGLKLYMSPN